MEFGKVSSFQTYGTERRMNLLTVCAAEEGSWSSASRSASTADPLPLHSARASVMLCRVDGSSALLPPLIVLRLLFLAPPHALCPQEEREERFVLHVGHSEKRTGVNNEVKID